MTKKETLELCREHWKFMAKTGSKEKTSYFDKIGLGEDDYPESDCYCCEYARKAENESQEMCEDCCPLNGYAWSDGYCMSSSSVYSYWLDAKYDRNIKKRKQIAEMMVYACDWALSELMNNNS